MKGSKKEPIMSQLAKYAMPLDTYFMTPIVTINKVPVSNAGTKRRLGLDSITPNAKTHTRIRR